MPGSSIQDFDLFKAALGNSTYLTDITSNTSNENKFLINLEKNQYTYAQLLYLIETITEPRVRSLIIIFLLSNFHYIYPLKGESLLKRLKYVDQYTPSRLNAFVHQLDLSMLSDSLIEELEPEAAVSILCSITHFSHLSTAQIKALIKRKPVAGLIVYWTTHFSVMPNAHYVLAQLIKLCKTLVIPTLNRMELRKKEWVINNVLEHLDTFATVITDLLDFASEESHLMQAIRLYLSGHYTKAYASYISELTQKLLDKKHFFSWAAIELLFCLNNKLAFDELKPALAHITSEYSALVSDGRQPEPTYNDYNKQDINELIYDLTVPVPEEKLTRLLEALKDYSLHPPPKEQYETRLKLHHLFHRIVSNRAKNPSSYQQLMQQESVLVINQFRLLELVLRRKELSLAKSLIKEMLEDSNQLRYIAEELRDTIPEYETEQETENLKDIVLGHFELNKLNSLVVETTEYMQSTATNLTHHASKWVEGWSVFFTSEIPKRDPVEDGPLPTPQID